MARGSNVNDIKLRAAKDSAYDVRAIRWSGPSPGADKDIIPDRASILVRVGMAKAVRYGAVSYTHLTLPTKRIV